MLTMSTETMNRLAVAFRPPVSNKMEIKSKLLLFTVVINVPLIAFSLRDDFG